MTKQTKPIRATTGDRGPPDGSVAIHTVEQLGPNMSRLPNGSLLCRNVPLSRTGWMMYGPHETPIEVGSRGVAYVERTHDTLFEDACLNSFVGAAVVDEHPNNDVTPANWKMLAKGVVLTARQGTKDDADVILGDLLINDAALIESVISGKREVSAGYDADYEQTGEGTGRQTGIIINHVALVMKGRCGPRCAIGDQEFSVDNQPEKELPMATKRVRIHPSPRRAVLDGLRGKVRDAENELADAMAADPDEGDPDASGDTHIHIHGSGGPGDDDQVKTEDDPYEARFAAIEGQLSSLGELLQQLASPEPDNKADPKPEPTKDEDGEKDEDKDGKTKDSSELTDEYQQVLAKAEVLVPGFRLPTFDAKAARKSTVDAMCQARRRALDLAYSTKDGARLIDGVCGKTELTLDAMPCAEVTTLFNSAAGAKALMNNQATRDSQVKEPVAVKGVKSLADVNKANQEFWAAQHAKQKL